MPKKTPKKNPKIPKKKNQHMESPSPSLKPRFFLIFFWFSLFSHPRHPTLIQPAQPPSGQRPRHPHDHFPLAEAPKVHPHADEVVEPRVGALVEEQGGEGAEGVDEEAGFDAAVHGGEGFCEEGWGEEDCCCC